MSKSEAKAVAMWIGQGIRMSNARAEAEAVEASEVKRKGKRECKRQGDQESKPVQFGAWSAEI